MESGSWREGESLLQPRVDLGRDESVGGLGTSAWKWSVVLVVGMARCSRANVADNIRGDA